MAYEAFQSAVAHAVIAYRPTCRDAAVVWTRVRVSEWLADITDSDLEAWANEIVDEARAVARRSGPAR